MPRTVSPSAFDSAVIRALRERDIDDVTARTLEDWRAVGGIDEPPLPRLRGFRPDYVVPTAYVDRVVEMRRLVRDPRLSLSGDDETRELLRKERASLRELAALRLLVALGEDAAPARARKLAARRPRLVRCAEDAERRIGRLPWKERRDAILNRHRREYGEAVGRVLDARGAVMLGVRKDERDSTAYDREPAGGCFECGRDVYLHRGETDRVEVGVALLCSACAQARV
jgi:hypothetical protein